MVYVKYLQKMYVIEIKYIIDEIFIQVYFILSEKRFRANIVQLYM